MGQDLVATIDLQLGELIKEKDKLMNERDKIKKQLFGLIAFFGSIDKGDLNLRVEEIKNKYGQQIADNFAMCKQNAVIYVTEFTQNRKGLDRIYGEIRKRIFDNIHQILEGKSRKDEKKIKEYLGIPEELDLFALEGIDIKDKPGIGPGIYDNLKLEVIKDYLIQTGRELGKKYLFSRFFKTFGINDLKRMIEVCGDDSDKMIVIRLIKNILSIPENINILKAIQGIDGIELEDAIKTIKKIKAENEILTTNSKLLLFELLISEISKEKILHFINNNYDESVDTCLIILKDILGIGLSTSILDIVMYPNKKETTNTVTINELITNTKTIQGKKLIIECMMNELSHDELINLFRDENLGNDDMELLKTHFGIPKGVDLNKLLSDEYIDKTDKKEKLKLLKKFTRFVGKLLLGKIIFKGLTLKDCFELVGESGDKEEDKKLLKLVKGIPEDPDILKAEFSERGGIGGVDKGRELTNKEINERCSLISRTTDYTTREELFLTFLKDNLFGENSKVVYTEFLDKLFLNGCINVTSKQFLGEKAFKVLSSKSDPRNVDIIATKYSEYNEGKKFNIALVSKNPFLTRLFYCDHTLLKIIFEKVNVEKLADFKTNNDFLDLINKNEDPEKLEIFRRRIGVILDLFDDDLTLSKIKRLRFWETLEKMNEWFIELLSKKSGERNVYSELIIGEIEGLIDVKVKYDIIHDTDERKDGKREQLQRTSSNVIKNMSFGSLDANLLSDPIVSKTLIEGDAFIFAVLIIRDILNIQYDINVKQSLDDETKKQKMDDSFIVTNIRHIAEMGQEILYIKDAIKRSLIDILLLSRIDDTKIAIRKAVQEDKRRKGTDSKK